MTDALLPALAAIVGPAHVLTAPEDIAPLIVERRGLFRGTPRAVVKPATTAEVAAIVKLASAAGTAIVPQGGNTGLVGGQIPDGSGHQILLNLTRLRQVRAIDPMTDTITVEAGATLAEVQAAAEAVDRLFPLSLASEGSCTIGGNLAANAGGTAVLAYGNARELTLGLEVVLADGTVWNGLSHLRKDNTGYDLKNLFIGSEGTLGIITAAVLKLYPRPRAIATAFCGLESPAHALRLMRLLKDRFGAALTTFELLPRIGLDFVLKHAPGSRDPLEGRHAWYALAELTSPTEGDLEPAMAAQLGQALEDGIIVDATIARSLTERDELWALRENMSEVQSREGGSIKHDVSVPVASVPYLIEEGCRRVAAYLPECRPVPFGHVGDGNIHFNFSQPVGGDKQAFLDQWDALNHIIHTLVGELGGSISAEHGIGQLKRDLLVEVKDPVALALMRKLKATLDPQGLFNPGKVL